MENLDKLIVDLMLILLSAGIVTVIFKKIKLPAVLGYLVVGILISPNMTYIPTTIAPDDIKVWADIGIMFLMFALGLEFSFHKIAQVGKNAIITSATVMPLMTIAGFATGRMLGWETMSCVFLGCMVSISSTMIILKSYDEMKLKQERFAQTVLGSLVIEDIVGIFMMIVLTTISVSSNFSGQALAKQLSTLMLTLVVILCVGIYIIPTGLKKIKDLVTDETLLIISLGLCLLMVVILTKVGFSEALGAFLAGSILAGTTFSDRIEHLVSPIKDLFGAIFFVSVGMMVNLSSIMDNIIPIIIITVVTVLGKMIFSSTGALIAGQDLRTAVRTGFSMVQVGEFSYILAALGMSLGVMQGYVYEVIVVVSVITIFLTPLFIKNGKKAADIIERKLPEKWNRAIERYSSESEKTHTIDSDWSRYIKGYILKTLVCSAVLVVILIAGVGFMHPHVNYKSDSVMIDVILAVAMIAAMAPFINIMCKRNTIDFNKLWVKSYTNRVPLIIGRVINVAISVIAVEGVISRVVVSIPILIRIATEILAVILIVRSDTLRGKALNLETRFIANFNAKILMMKKHENKTAVDPMGILENVYTIDFKTPEGSGKTKVSEFSKGRKFRVAVVQIKRANGEYVNVIKGNTTVYDDDIITVAGSKNNLDGYMISLKDEESRILNDGRMITLKERLYRQIFDEVDHENQLICVEIPVTKEMSFYKKQIKDNDFRTRYKGSIIGIERNHLPILNPNPNYILHEGDIIWALGTRIMMDEIISSKLIIK